MITDLGHIHTAQNTYNVQLIMLVLLPTAIRNMEER
jgi:hypothetical protein